MVAAPCAVACDHRPLLPVLPVDGEGADRRHRPASGARAVAALQQGLRIEGSAQRRPGPVSQFLCACGSAQRPVCAVFCRSVTASSQLGPVALRLQALCPCRDMGGPMLCIRLRRDGVEPPGGVRVEVVPAGPQQLRVETARPVPQPRARVDPGFGGSGPPGGGRRRIRAHVVRHPCPLWATSCRHVLPPVRGVPTRRVLGVLRRPIRLRRAVPVTGLLRLPGGPGAEGASHVLRRLSACLPWPVDAGGPPPPGHSGGLVLPSGA